MARNRYYYYDEESFSFVELKTKRSRIIKQGGAIFALSCVLALFITWGMDRLIGTPQELALMEENSVLQSQLSNARTRLSDFSNKLEELSRSDNELYRTILQAEPVSEEIRQAGVGGADVYEDFARFSPGTADLLRETSQQLDELERKVNLQNDSYRELTNLAEKRSAVLAQTPAILPTNGRVTSGRGMRFHPILHVNRMHHGIDILVPIGTDVHASGDGVIYEAGQNSGLGKFVKVSHPATGYITTYAHLNRITPGIRPGRKVSRGDVIGLSGNTGLSAAPHLHYEVREAASGRSVNPILFFLPNMSPDEYQKLYSELEQMTTSLGS